MPRSPKRAQRSPRSARSAGALLRLAAALLLFSVCFAAKTQFPSQTQRWRSQLWSLIGQRTDLRESLTWLGEELEQQRSALHAVGDWCVEVFGAQEVNLPAAALPEQAEAAQPWAQREADASEGAESEPEPDESAAWAQTAPEAASVSAALVQTAPEAESASAPTSSAP